MTGDVDSLDEEPIDSMESLDPPLHGKRVALAGKFGAASRRDAAQWVRSAGATVLELDAQRLDVIVLGAEESPVSEAELLSPEIRDAVARGELELIPETELWQRLGLDEAEAAVKRLYTPAMLSELLGVSVRVIRRWHRRGLIVPARTVMKLPYFDFQEIATARRLAELMAAGASAEAIERTLDSLAQVLPDVQRPLAQLSVLIEGRQVLLRQGEGLIEPSGQLRIDFDAFEASPHRSSIDVASTVPLPYRDHTAFPLPDSESADDDPLIAAAFEFEDAGDLPQAIDCYRGALARDGARADLCFQLAELLYRSGEIEAARERYYMAIELDEQFVEARASLASVLAETGRNDLAIAAFRGALAMHDDYPDVHYNLARTLDDIGQRDEANHHWQRFLALAPLSPWAEEARQRLGADPR
jgi:tetratricopeptide (TPR) repeat protein